MIARRIAAVVGLGFLLGCVGPGMVALRPDGSPGPEPCPREALRAMEILGLLVGDTGSIDLDANKIDASTITVYDGPIESALERGLSHVFPPATNFYGKVWTSGPWIVIRYYEARRLDGTPAVPICAVARRGGDELKKIPGPARGSAVLDFSEALIVIVDSFR